MMLQETTSQPYHAEYMIAREREYEKIQQKLYEEFKQLDINNDGFISLEEIRQFLQSKVTLIFQFAMAPPASDHYSSN